MVSYKNLWVPTSYTLSDIIISLKAPSCQFKASVISCEFYVLFAQQLAEYFYIYIYI